MIFKTNTLLLILLLVVFIIFLFFKWQNNSITITNINFKNNKIKKAFNNYTILHISDLHNKEFGKGQKNLIKKIKKLNPNMIIITGDLINSYNTNIPIVLDLIKAIIKIAPIFYVSGNHEIRTGLYDYLNFKLKKLGVTLLDNKRITLYKEDSQIEILGLRDISYNQKIEKNFNKKEYILNKLNELSPQNNNFKILLSHRPELFSIYSKTNIDLIFSGHAHGGQFRLPGLLGLFAPNQGFFPKLSEGIHNKNNTSIVISRGLGNSSFPLRLFNRPELLLIKLHTSK